MNSLSHSRKFARATRILFALFAGLFLTHATRSQPVETNVDSRFLFIFDTSSDMKKRVPAEQKTLNELLALSVGGQLHSGDSLGVWTFDQNLHTGQFPLQHWESTDAVMIASNIAWFIDRQKYSKKTRFAALQPLLTQIAQRSERLTVFIFCDGETPMTGTPFDAGINNVFRQREAEFKKKREPLVVTLRVQLGQYVGCTMSFPPAPVNLPQFPPLPLPPAPKVTNAPAVVAPAIVPSLVIIGTNVGTNLPPPGPPPDAPTNTEPITPTNVISEPPTNSLAPINAPEQTNAAALPSQNSNASGNGLLAAGAIILAVAIIGGILIASRARRKDKASLISRSMNERK